MKKLYGIILLILLTSGFNFAQYTKLWEVNVGTYSWFANDHGTRGLAVNPSTGHLLVASKTAPHGIYILNSVTGTVIDTLDMTGVSGGTYNINLVRVAKDGVIYACNLALDNGTLKLYRWANEAAAPTVAFEGTVTKRAGDSFNLSGTGVNTKLYVSGSLNPVLEVFSTTDGIVFTKGTPITLPAASQARGGITPIADNQEGGFWVKGAGTSAIHIDGTGTQVELIPDAKVSNSWFNVKYFERAGLKYLAFVGRNSATEGLQVRLFDITTSATEPIPFMTMSLTNTYNGNSNACGDVDIVVNPGDDSFILYQVVTNNGIAAYKTNLMTIAKAREDLDADLKPDRLGDTVTVYGVVTSPNYQTVNVSHYITDGTAGIDAFKYGLKPNLVLGDSIMITGKVEQYKGLVEIVAPDTLNIKVIKSGAAVPEPQEITIAQYKADHEKYEGSLILMRNLSKISGTWPTSGNATLKVTNGTDTLDLYIDSDTEIKSISEPTWPQDVVGIASQFASSGVAAGLQLLPRYKTDFLAPVPVELLSLNSKVSGNVVSLIWQTATETNNMGFEVYRNNEMIKFVPGFGTTAEKRSYSFEDKSVAIGKHLYKLIQVDYSGIKETVGSIEVDVNSAPAGFTLNQNYPNPFNPTTVIAFSLPVDARVNLKIMNVLGEEVATLVNSNLASGLHQITFNASDFNSGIYFYSIEINGIDGNNFSGTKKMMLVK